MPHQCAHWFAMTCKYLQGVSVCKDAFLAANRQCPGITRAGGKFLHVIARSEATWQSASPAAGHDRKQYFGRIRKSATDLPKVVPTCQVSLRGNGLPHQCAHWLAMTCRRQRRVCGCKAVVPGKPTRRLQVCHWAGVLANVDTRQILACHCEERSDVAIRFPAVEHNRKQHLGRIRKASRICPKYY